MNQDRLAPIKTSELRLILPLFLCGGKKKALQQLYLGVDRRWRHQHRTVLVLYASSYSLPPQKEAKRNLSSSPHRQRKSISRNVNLRFVKQGSPGPRVYVHDKKKHIRSRPKVPQDYQVYKNGGKTAAATWAGVVDIRDGQTQTQNTFSAYSTGWAELF